MGSEKGKCESSSEVLAWYADVLADVQDWTAISQRSIFVFNIPLNGPSWDTNCYIIELYIKKEKLSNSTASHLVHV